MTLGSNWGTTERERSAALECDELLQGAPIRLNRGITIEAPPARVFRWLCQLKLAPYSYDLLDNFGRRSPRELVAGVERLQVGQRFMTIFRLACFAYDEHITLRSRGVAVTYAVAGHDDATRLVARVLFRAPGGRLGRSSLGSALALGDLVMMRKQLLTLKELAERETRADTQSLTP